MTRRDFIQGGLKLIGFWLLATGIMQLINAASLVAIASMGVGKEMNVQWMRSQSLAMTAVFQIVFAVYLCRRGQWVVNFLDGKLTRELGSSAQG